MEATVHTAGVLSRDLRFIQWNWTAASLLGGTACGRQGQSLSAVGRVGKVVKAADLNRHG